MSKEKYMKFYHRVLFFSNEKLSLKINYFKTVYMF